MIRVRGRGSGIDKTSSIDCRVSMGAPCVIGDSGGRGEIDGEEGFTSVPAANLEAAAPTAAAADEAAVVPATATIATTATVTPTTTAAPIRIAVLCFFTNFFRLWLCFLTQFLHSIASLCPYKMAGSMEYASRDEV